MARVPAVTCVGAGSDAVSGVGAGLSESGAGTDGPPLPPPQPAKTVNSHSATRQERVAFTVAENIGLIHRSSVAKHLTPARFGEAHGNCARDLWTLKSRPATDPAPTPAQDLPPFNAPNVEWSAARVQRSIRPRCAAATGLGRRVQRSVQALEQGHAEEDFQGRPGGSRRARQRPLVGGAGEAQVPRGGSEGFELIQRWRSRWRLRVGVACPTRMQPIQEYRLNGVRCSRSLLSTRCRALRRVADDECTSCMRSTAGCMPAEPLAARAAA